MLNHSIALIDGFHKKVAVLSKNLFFLKDLNF